MIFLLIRHCSTGNARQLAPPSSTSHPWRRERPIRSFGRLCYRGMVRLTDVNAICGTLRKEKAVTFPTWEDRARIPKDHYTMHKS